MMEFYFYYLIFNWTYFLQPFRIRIACFSPTVSKLKGQNFTMKSFTFQQIPALATQSQP